MFFRVKNKFFKLLNVLTHSVCPPSVPSRVESKTSPHGKIRGGFGS